MFPLLILSLANATEYKCLSKKSILLSEPVANAAEVFSFSKPLCHARVGLESDGYTRVDTIKGSGWTDSSNLTPAPTIDKNLTSKLKRSSDSENISANPYFNDRVDCSEYAHLHDVIKDTGKELDRILRDGISMEVEDEYALGKKIVGEITKKINGRLVSSGPEHEYLNSLLKKVLPKTTRKDMTYTLYLVEDADVENAFATPGGFLYITDKLLDNWIDNEAQLMAVIGHEVAHVDLKHTTALAEYYILLEQQGSNLALDIAHTVISSPYSSLQESEADQASLQWLVQLGYSPFAVANMWDQLAPEESPVESSGSDSLLDVALDIGITVTETVLESGLAFIESHPPPQKRACEIRQTGYDLLHREDVSSEQRLYKGKDNYKYKRPFPSSVY